MSPTVYTHLLLPCPTCQGEQYREVVEDSAPPGALHDTAFCHECEKYDGLRECWLPMRVVLTAFREGNTDRQACAELHAYLKQATSTWLEVAD